MELMVNATVRRHMKERRPIYVRWKGNWYSGEVVRCGPAYVYKVRGIDVRLVAYKLLPVVDSARMCRGGAF